MDEKDKEEKEIEDKKKESKSTWGNIPPIVLIIGGLLIFFIFQSMKVSGPEGKNTQFMFFALILLIAYLLMKGQKQLGMVTPREAELLVERDLDRKQRWGQFSPMSKFSVGPCSDIMHRDARGVFYDVQVTEYRPFKYPKHWIAKVMAKDEERTFVTFTESIGPMKRPVTQEEKMIKDKWFEAAERSPALGRFLFGMRK